MHWYIGVYASMTGYVVAYDGMGQIFSDCTIKNVRHVAKPIRHTFPIVHSEKI